MLPRRRHWRIRRRHRSDALPASGLARRTCACARRRATPAAGWIERARESGQQVDVAASPCREQRRASRAESRLRRGFRRRADPRRRALSHAAGRRRQPPSRHRHHRRIPRKSRARSRLARARSDPVRHRHRWRGGRDLREAGRRRGARTGPGHHDERQHAESGDFARRRRLHPAGRRDRETAAALCVTRLCAAGQRSRVDRRDYANARRDRRADPQAGGLRSGWIQGDPAAVAHPAAHGFAAYRIVRRLRVAVARRPG
ncbi:hypothetical protein QFZ97_007888 [Paraburkholderia youngii]